ncbi:MAG: SCO6745 family protein [Acidimicrobiales bacterium]
MPVSPLTARKTWRTVEPIHSMVYFAPEASASYAQLGIRQESGYFMSRSAPMGAVRDITVIATFYNFRPALVHSAMAGAWESVTPEQVLAARLEAADTALRRLLGDEVGSPEMERTATLARAAAVRACERCGGRPLFAGHAGLDWPAEPHVVLWHAQTLLREFRGDGHIAALLMYDLDPVEALVMHAASGEVPVRFLRSTRGWTDAEWEDGVARLRGRGWVEQAAGGGLALSTEGLSVRQRIEDVTDRRAVFPYQALGEDGCAELRTLARPFSRTVVEAAGLGL